MIDDETYEFRNKLGIVVAENLELIEENERVWRYVKHLESCWIPFPLGRAWQRLRWRIKQIRWTWEG